MENDMEIPQKINNRATIWSSYPTSECLCKENENTNLKRYTHSTFIKALYTIAKTSF